MKESSINLPPRFKVVVDLHLLLRYGNKLLLGKRINTGYYDGAYHFPSGHMEARESALAGLVRETKEEVGISIEEKDAKLVHIMHNSSSGGRIALFFEVTSCEKEPMNMEPEKCAELRWFDIEALPNGMIPYAQEAARAYREGVVFSQYGW